MMNSLKMAIGSWQFALDRNVAEAVADDLPGADSI
jgi:hypothetical protein